MKALLLLCIAIGSTSPALAQEWLEPAYVRALKANQLHAVCSREHEDRDMAEVSDAWCATLDSTIVAFLRSPFDGLDAPGLDDIPEPPEVITAELSETSRFAGQLAVQATGRAPAPMLLSSSAFVAGLTDFLVHRARDEVVFSFVLQLKEAPIDPVIRSALPRTERILGRIGSLNFNTLLPVLRSALLADLVELPERIGQPAFYDTLDAAPPPGVVQLTSLLYGLGLDIRSGATSRNALAQLAHIEPAQVNLPSLRAALRMTGLLSIEDLESIIAPVESSRELAAFFFAFLGHDAAGRDLADAPEEYRRFLAQVADFYDEEGRALLRGIIGLQNRYASEDSTVRAEAVALSTISLLRWISDLPTPAALQPDGIRRAINEAAYVYTALTAGNYGAMVVWLTGVFTDLTAQDIRYVSFATALATAETPEQVEAVLQSAAAPIGSYRSKRRQDGGERQRSASVVAYLGAGTGHEESVGVAGAATDDDAVHMGLALPVGVELSRSASFGAVSLFMSILDLGTFASFRFDKEDAVESTPKGGLRQALAPGLFLVLNLTRDFPLSVGTGFQYVPALRTSELTGDEVDVVRWSAFVGIDATLFHMRF